MQNKRVNAERNILAYIIGVALGDGNLSNTNCRAVRLRITCDIRYPALIKKFCHAIQILLPVNRVSIVKKRTRNAVDISCYSNQWEKWLGWKAKEGSKYCQKVSVPRWVFEKRKYMIACLSGLIETDGSVYRDRGYEMVNFVATIPTLARDTMVMLKRLGFHPKRYVFKGMHKKKITIRVARNVTALINTLHLGKASVGG